MFGATILGKVIETSLGHAGSFLSQSVMAGVVTRISFSYRTRVEICHQSLMVGSVASALGKIRCGVMTAGAHAEAQIESQYGQAAMRKLHCKSLSHWLRRTYRTTRNNPVVFKFKTTARQKDIPLFIGSLGDRLLASVDNMP